MIRNVAEQVWGWSERRKRKARAAKRVETKFIPKDGNASCAPIRQENGGVLVAEPWGNEKQ